MSSPTDKEASTEPPSRKKTKSALDEILGATVDDTCLSTCLEEELQLFFSERPVATDRDPLRWWEINEERFPNVAKQAKQLLCLPETSVPSEQVFSSSGVLVNKLRCSLSSDNVNMIIFLSKNRYLPSACSRLLSVSGLPNVVTMESEQQSLGEGTCKIDMAAVLDEKVSALPDLNEHFPNLQDSDDISSIACPSSSSVQTFCTLLLATCVILLDKWYLFCCELTTTGFSFFGIFPTILDSVYT